MKQSGLTIFFAAFMTALFSACSDFGDMEIPTEELYARSFVKEFGVYDQNHTWCVATPTSITINPQSLINEVKVYSRTDGHYYYVARYTNLYKTTTITFDAPAGTTDLKLKIDGTTYYAQAGTTLTVSGGSRASRAEKEDETEWDETTWTWNTTKNSNITWAVTPNMIFDSYGLRAICRTTDGVLPENENNLQKDGDGIVYEDFKFSAKAGDYLVFYPIFYYTGSTHILGIYFIDEDTGTFDWIEVDSQGYPVFENKDIVLYDSEGNFKAENYFIDLWKSKNFTMDYSISTDDGKTWSSYAYSEQQFSHPAAASSIDFHFSKDYDVKVRASGIKLKFTGDVNFGFYIKVDPTSRYTTLNQAGVDKSYYDHIMFSQAIRNQYYGKVLLGGWGDTTDDAYYYVRDQITDLVDVTNRTISYTAQNRGAKHGAN